MPPGCRQDPNHKPRTTAGWSSGPSCGEGKGQNWRVGGQMCSGSSLVNDPDPARSHQLGWNHACLVPGTSHGRRGQVLEASVAQDRDRGTGSWSPWGSCWPPALEGHLKGKVMRGIRCFPRQLPVRGLTPHSGGRYAWRGGYGGSASQGVQDTNLRSTSVCPS